MDIGKWKILAVSMTLICSLAVPVLAYEYFFRTPNYTFQSGIILQTYPTPTMQIGFYWDAACTQPVTIMDFGEVVHPNYVNVLVKVIFIRNEGSAWNKLYWNSTLSTVTDEIQEQWSSSSSWDSGWGFNGTQFGSGEVKAMYYKILLPAYATAGTFDWTLTVWGEHYY